MAKLVAKRAPCSRDRMPIVAMLVAGPVSSNASPAPGDTPAATSTATSGVEAEAQTYSGNPMAAKSRTSRPAGKRVIHEPSSSGPSNAATISPTRIHGAV